MVEVGALALILEQMHTSNNQSLIYSNAQIAVEVSTLKLMRNTSKFAIKYSNKRGKSSTVRHIELCPMRKNRS